MWLSRGGDTAILGLWNNAQHPDEKDDEVGETGGEGKNRGCQDAVRGTRPDKKSPDPKPNMI